MIIRRWPFGDDELLLLGLANRLRSAGLWGESTLHGAPDELLLLSGGPLSDLAEISALAGPPTLRAVCRQPARSEQPPLSSAASALAGEVTLGLPESECVWVVESWKNGRWVHRFEVRGENLAASLRPLGGLSPDVESKGVDLGLLPGNLAGLLTYDLVQWTEPVRLRNLPRPRDLLGLLYRCDRWLVHDRHAGSLTLACLDEDVWAHQTITCIEAWLEDGCPHSPSDDASTTFPLPAPTSTITDEEHAAAVRTVHSCIEQGLLYQLNYGRAWEGSIDSPWRVFEALAVRNPAPFSGWLHAPDLGCALASSSPELLLSQSEGRLSTRPIKGTCPRGRTPEEDARQRRALAASRKELSEHMMLVDLERNDLGRVCATGSVRWSDWRIETFPDVQHMVSEVQGRLRPGLDGWDALQALFPGGSITGCPKTVTVASIDELEGEPRRAWTGSLGHHDPRTGVSAWNILIRTLEAERDDAGEWRARVKAGGGLVIESDPQREVAEAKWKARGLLEAAWSSDPCTDIPTGESSEIHPVPTVDERTRALARARDEVESACIAPAQPIEWFAGDPPLELPAEGTRRLLFIDNLDSFSWNIVHLCCHLGAEVVVVCGRGVDVSDDIRSLLKSTSPTHLVLGPGPGRPEQSPLTMELASLALAARLNTHEQSPLPLLGVCLGMQAIGVASDWPLSPSPLGAVHGVPTEITHTEDDLFAGLASPAVMMRYHSLVLAARGSMLEITAHDSLTGTLPMALRHPSLPVWGVQFHPESAGSVAGWKVLDNFLAMRPSTTARSVEMPREGRAE